MCLLARHCSVDLHCWSAAMQLHVHRIEKYLQIIMSSYQILAKTHYRNITNYRSLLLISPLRIYALPPLQLPSSYIGGLSHLNTPWRASSSTE